LNPNRTIFFLFFLGATLVYVLGLFVEVMDVDAAQYASISREMLNNQHYLQVLYNGQNYLDKPPMLFWLSALSFKIFGINTFAYKFPSFLFTLLGIYSTSRLATRLYDKWTGLIAALILYTCQGFFLFNNDVRTDTILTGASVFGAWQLLLFYEQKRISNLILGFTGIAFAMMAKGPIGIVVPASAIASHIAYRRDWNKIFQWQWIAGILWMMLLLLPMLYGLYEQYGWHGPKFFFWTQSFGRITGENVWKNNAGYFFFVHSFLWAFLPWSLLAIAAVFSKVMQLFRSHFKRILPDEMFSLGGFILPFIALSFSQYKLPHYIFVLFPYAAILCSSFIYEPRSTQKNIRFMFVIHYFLLIILWTAAIILCSYIFPMFNIIHWIIFIMIFLSAVFVFQRKKDSWNKFIFVSALSAIGINFILNVHAYPQLLKYQAGSELAKIAISQRVPKDKVFFFKDGINSFEFYFQSVVLSITEDGLRSKIDKKEDCWVIGGEDLMQVLKQNDLTPVRIFETNDYAITRLNIHFLKPSERNDQLKKKYLVEL